MVAWFEILVTAFLLQLLALPGEKGQMVIAALATKYSPYIVVAGAATAFGGWTVLEILLGNALKGALPAVLLDGITNRVGGRLDNTFDIVPARFAGFGPSFSLMVFGEFGDKTQLTSVFS